MKPTTLLILGGTREALDLAHRIADNIADKNEIRLITSLAGRTSRPAAIPGEVHSGGFGGLSGIIEFINGQSVDVLIDATHPFARMISQTARAACAQLQLPLLRLERPAWQRVAGDVWIEAGSLADAASRLPQDAARILLACGRKNIECFAGCNKRFFLVRLIEAPDTRTRLPLHNYELMLARGPFCKKDEIALLQYYRIDAIVSKNSGGFAAYAKIAAARDLGLPVVMIKRPPAPGGELVSDIDGALVWLKEKLKR